LKSSNVTKIAFACSSFAAVLTASQEASAQLNLGKYGVQPGLEPNYLKYQLSGEDLSNMQGIPGCDTGFGLSCNKTGSVLEKILEANNGPTYQDLLLRAAGGEDNFRNFATFYNNNSNLPLVPYASFWRDDANTVMDGHQYLLGQTVSRTPVEGLGQVTNNFYWSPLHGNGNSLDPRSGLLNLKYSYGRLLLEEIAKVPNIQEQIESLNLNPAQSKYYLATLSSGLRALKTGNDRQLKDNILRVLSMPFDGTGEGNYLNRPNLDIPDDEVDWATGQGLLGDVFDIEPIALTPDVETGLFGFDVEGYELVGGSGGFSWWPLLGVLAVVPFLFGGDDNSSNSPPVAVAPPGDTNPPVVTPPPPVVTPPPPVVTPPPEVKKVPEPSTVTPYVLMAFVMFLLCQKHWRLQTKG
jgi:hypothetical protein